MTGKKKEHKKKEWEDDSEDDTAGESPSDEDLQAYEDEMMTKEEAKEERTAIISKPRQTAKKVQRLGKENEDSSKHDMTGSGNSRLQRLRQKPRVISAAAVIASLTSPEQATASPTRSTGSSGKKRKREEPNNDDILVPSI